MMTTRWPIFVACYQAGGGADGTSLHGRATTTGLLAGPNPAGMIVGQEVSVFNGKSFGGKRTSDPSESHKKLVERR